MSDLDPNHVRVVRLGHGANCSSVGSVVDILFASAAVGGAVIAALCAAMRDEPVVVVGSPPQTDPPTDPPQKAPARTDSP